jgi:hypothetical protein
MSDVDDRLRDGFRALAEQYGQALELPDRLRVDATLQRRSWLRHPAVLVAGIAVAVTLIAGLSALIAATVRGGSAEPAATSTPTARQLAAGRWQPIPSAPVKSCDQTVSWDGTDLVVVDTQFGRGCAAQAAAYDPVTNAWTTITSPPPSAGRNPISAWDGSRLILVSSATSQTFAWHPGGDTWQPLTPLPGGEVAESIFSTGAMTVAAGVRISGHGVTHAGSLYRLDGTRWTALPDIPSPATGTIGEIALGGINQALYAVVSDSVHHSNPHDTYTTGSARTLRLDPTGWTLLEHGTDQPLSQLTSTPVRNGLLIAGSGCPADTPCMEEAGAAGLLSPHAGMSDVESPDGMPYPRDVTAGGTAVVVTFPIGSIGAPIAGPRAGTTWIYNVPTGDWLRGPTAPATVGDDGTYWTPRGVITLGAPAHSGLGGAILVPAK